MEHFLTLLLVSLLLVSCGGQGGSDAIGEGIQFGSSSCLVPIKQDQDDIAKQLEQVCGSSFEIKAFRDAAKVKLDKENGCSFLNVSERRYLEGTPSDDDVGLCDLKVNIEDEDGNTYSLEAKIDVKNINPALSVTNVTITEDDPIAEIKSDLDIQSNEEGFGFYSFDHSKISGERCVDHGTLSIDMRTGAIMFGPDTNYAKTCQVAVKFDDLNADSTPVVKIFDVLITSTNDTPVLSGSCSSTVINQDQAFSCNSISLTDIDVEDSHVWSFDAAHTCTWASIDTSTGVVTGSPNDDQVGTCNLAIRAYDGQVYSNTYSQSITINNVTPVIATITNQVAILEDSSTQVVYAASDVTSSEQGFGVYSLDDASASSPKCNSNGVATINTTNGEISYTPAADYDGTCNLRVVFDDQNGFSNTTYQDISIVVTPVNDVHAITSVCGDVNELAAYSCTGAYTDTEGDSVSWSLLPATTCSWASINPANGNVSGIPQRADVGACDLVMRADDGEHQVDRTYNINVLNVIPSFTISDTTLTEDSPATVIKADGDVSSTDEGYGSYSIIAASSNDCQSQGTVSIDTTTGAITYTPALNFDQSCNINVQFDDGKPSDNIGTNEFQVTMIPVPDNAVVSLPASCDGNFDEDITYTCTPIINDPDTGDTHTWSIDANTCSWISGVVASTGVMSGTPNDDNVGSCSFTIKATGDQDSLVTSTLSANVTIDNVKPILSADANPVNINMQHTSAPAAYSSVISNTASVFDTDSTDGGGLGVFSLTTPSSGTDCSSVADTLSIDTNNGEITFLPNNMWVGTCYVAVSFDDQNSTDNIADTLEVTVNVNDQVPPNIIYIDSTTADGTVQLSDTVDLVVKFDEPLAISTSGGSPRLFLETGAIDREAVYIGINGDRTELSFQYTVQENDYNTDLNIHSTVSFLDLAGATIEDDYSNAQVNYAVPKPADASGNSLQERRDILVDGSVASASATGLPTLVSPAQFLDVDVSGSGLTEYQYKVLAISDGNSDCSLATGYSGNVDESVNITDSLTTFALGTQIKICIVGVNSAGTVSPYTSAFEYVWTKDVNSVQKIDFGSVNDLPNFQDSEVDPDNPNIIYARNLLGEIYKTIDYGQNWVKFCSVPQTYETRMVVSPGPDRTPYVYQNNTIYKIESKNGGSCQNLLSGAGLDVFTRYSRDNVSITITGDLYILTTVNGPNEVWRSFDQGSTWSLYATISQAVDQNDSLSFELNPHDVSNFLIASYTSTPPGVLNGIYQTTDGGTSFTKVNALFNTGFNTFSWHPTDSDIVYQALRPFTGKSLDGGTTWENSGESSTTYLKTDLFHRFDIDQVTGYGYRLITSSGDTLLQRSTNISVSGNTSWTTIYTFSNQTGLETSSKNISVSGNTSTPTEPTISINLQNRMWISSDGGSTWTEQFAPEELKLFTIAGAGDDAIYGATKDWFVVKTTDNGQNWTYKVGDYYHCLGKPPKLAVNQLNTNNILMWTENFGTIDCDNFNYSVNGMNSMISRDEFSMVSPKLVMSLSTHNPNRYYMSGKVGTGSFRFHLTENAANETQLKYNSGNEFSDPMPDSYIHPHDPQKVWIVDNVSNGRLYEHDIGANTKTNLTSNTGLSSIAGLDVYIGDLGQYYIRVMDKTGRMKVSTDYGATFVDEGVTGSPLTSCDKRLLYHHPRDRNLVVTGCLNTDVVAISKNRGQTWDETDFLAEYGIDCQLRGMAVSSSRMYIGCVNSDTMIFNYSFASLENDVADSVLTASENAGSTDLVAHFFPGLYTNLEYAVIDASTVCDGSVTGFSTTIPTTSHASFTTRGEYKVCIKQTDVSASITYTTTSTIFFDTGSPTFTSIDLVNDAIDGEITFSEHYTDNNLVGNLISSDHDFVKYDVVSSSTTCDGNLKYDYGIPKSNDDALTLAGTYKVCVELITRGDTTRIYGASSNFTYVPTEAFAVLSGTPEAYVSIDDALDVTVGGTGVTQYKYKIVDVTIDSCGSSSGYSSAIPIATKISDSLTGYSNGDNLILCVVGGDSSGYFQANQRATRHYWVYSTGYRLDPIDFSSASTFSDWRQVAVAPSDANIIYGLNSMGEVWKSIDNGSSWNHMCTIEHYKYKMHLKVSPGPDATAYISYHHRALRNDYDRIYRVDDYSGRGCSSLLGSFRGEVLSDFVQATFSLSPRGELFVVENQYDSMVVRKSTDYGRNWSFVGQLQDSGLQGQIYISPHDPDIMLINSIASNSGSGSAGLYRSTDGGETWSFIRSTGFTSAQYIFFDPINPGRVYANNQYYSTDNGASWSTSASLDANGNRWWVANNGAGYRLEQVGSDTVLYRDTDLSTIGFSSLYTFSGVLNGDGSNDIVTATGNTISVVIGKNFFLSTDGGTSFNQIFWPGKGAYLTGISSLDGQRVFGVTRGWSILESSDYADSWSYKTAAFSESCGYQGRVLTHPLNDDYNWVYGTSCRYRAVGTSDGFNSRNLYDDGSDGNVDGYFTNMTNPGNYGLAYTYSGGDSFRMTANSWSSASSSLTDSFGYLSGNDNFPSQMNYTKVSDPNTFLVIEVGDGVSELRTSPEIEIASISSRMSFGDAVGMSVIADKDRLELGHLFISRRGKMNVTYDDGKTFSSLGDTSSPLADCASRLVYVNQKNNDLVSSVCFGQNIVSWSVDGGDNWNSLDLETTYAMTCDLTGVIINESEVMFSCNGWYQGMKFSHTPVDLINVASDSIIRQDEVAGVSIVQIDYPSYYSSIEYTLISSGSSCNGTTSGFSTSAPLDTDLSVDGSYQVCAKLTNSSGTSYRTSSTFLFDNNPPSFTSIDLNGVAINGVQAIDYLESSDDLVTNLVASNYSRVRYALVASTTTCDDSITYGSTIPKVNSALFTDEGSYHVCVVVSDGVNDPAYGTSPVINFSKDYYVAKLSNVPSPVSSDNLLNITVSGSGVLEYRYKVGISPVDCSVDSGYSTAIGVATAISDDISGLGANEIDICVQGQNSVDGKHQLLRSATKYTFTRSTSDIDYIKLNISNYANEWFDVEVAKWDSLDHIYARDIAGNIFLSSNRGTSFELLCSVEPDLESRIVIGPKKELGVYVTSNNKAYRVEDRLGGTCPEVSVGFTSVVSTFRRAPIAFTRDAILIMDEVDATTTYLKKSFDNGQTWSTLNTFTNPGTSLSIFVDPFNDNNFFITYEGTSATYNGAWIVSLNGGASFESIDPAGASDISEIQNVNMNFMFDPVNKGLLIANNGYYSNDNAQSFRSNNGIVSDYTRFDIDNTGMVYRLVQDGADIDVEISSAADTPAFSTFMTISNVSAAANSRTVSSSGDGATIAVILNNSLYISLDGASFSQINTPKVSASLSSITSEDESVVYGVDNEWNIFKSTDSSSTWAHMDKHSSGCSGSKIRIRTTKSDSDYVLAYADDDSAGCGDFFRSVDGFSTSSVTSGGSSSLTLVMDPANKNNTAVIGNGAFLVSTDFFSSNSLVTTNTVSNIGHGFDGFMSTVDTNFIYNVVGGHLFEIDSMNNTKSSITSGLSFSYPATLEGFADGSVYVISRTGQIDQSVNDAGSFSPYSSDPGLTSCQTRILKALSSDKANFITTACYGGQTIAYTSNAGASWSEIDLSSFAFSSSCTINDIALVDESGTKKMAIACVDKPALKIKLP